MPAAGKRSTNSSAGPKSNSLVKAGLSRALPFGRSVRSTPQRVTGTKRPLYETNPSLNRTPRLPV